MSEHIKKFVDDLSNGNNADAGEAFKDALRAKVADSDPKPVVTDPAPETETVMDTQGNEIAFTDNGNEQPTPESEVPANDESQPTT